MIKRATSEEELFLVRRSYLCMHFHSQKFKKGKISQSQIWGRKGETDSVNLINQFPLFIALHCQKRSTTSMISGLKHSYFRAEIIIKMSHHILWGQCPFVSPRQHLLPHRCIARVSLICALVNARMRSQTEPIKEQNTKIANMAPEKVGINILFQLFSEFNQSNICL